MTGYSLSFFASGKYDKEWYDKLTPEIAERAAERARIAGCEPNPESNIKCGVATSWLGPDQGEVMRRLKRHDENAMAE